jgi:hypothetical protein
MIHGMAPAKKSFPRERRSDAINTGTEKSDMNNPS